MKNQFKYAVAETVKYVANSHSMTNDQVIAMIEQGGNRIADEFNMVLALTFDAKAGK